MRTESTASELRKTGISVIGDMPWGAHLCHFYETKQDLLEILIPYFKAGLENNEFCIWVVSDPLGEEEARNALRQVVPEADQYLAAGHIEIVPHTLFPTLRQRPSSGEHIEIIPHTEWYLKNGAFIAERVLNGWKQKLADALAKGYAGLRANGNEAWLTEENWKAFSEYEKTLDKNLAGQRMIVLCSYPLSRSSAAQIFDVVNTHQLGILRRRGKWERIETPEPIQAKAEIKRLNKELRRALDKRSEPPAILRYGVAVLSVIAAVITLLLMDTSLQAAAYVSVFLCAVIFSTWFGGIRPGLLAIVLSVLAFAYVLPPPESFAVEIPHLPRLLLFALLAFFVGSLTAAQRNKAASLRRARDVLDGTVQQLKRTNEALRREITERKQAQEALRQSEDRLRLAIDTIPTMAWSLRPDGALDFVNERWLNYAGLTFEEAIEQPTDAVHPDDLPRVMEKWLADKAAGKASEDEMRLRRADGEYRWFLVRTAPLHDEHGKIVKWFGSSVDIEDRKQAEKDLEEANRQLKILSRRRVKVQEEERRHLARELHDEIGQALTAAKINLQAAMKESYGAKSKRIHETAAILDRLLGQVRQISLDLRPSMLDDLGLVPALRSLLDEHGRRASVAVHFSAENMPENLDPEIQTTCFRIAQEAITNAVRHANATRIDVDLVRENGNLRLQVRDNGRGFDAESVQEQVIGLGLIGIKERAALVDARAKVISSPNKGTTVEVLLPLTFLPEREVREIGK